MRPRHLIGLFVLPLLLAPSKAVAVTCDGRALADAGVPTLLSGCGDARISELAPALGIDRDELERMDVVTTPAGKVVRLRQEVDGVPVFNGQLAVRFGPRGGLDMVQASTIAEPPLSTTPSVSAADAMAATGFASPAAELVIYPDGSPPVLAWHVSSTSVGADLNAMVDAQTGAILRTWNDIRNASAPGSVFDPNPVQTSGNTALSGGLPPLEEDDASADAEQVNVTLENLNSAASLEGSYVSILGSPAYAPGSYPRGDAATRFEAVNAYYAIDRAQTKIQELGFTDVNNRPIEVTVNAGPADNSFYMPSTESVYFGTGGVDDAEDSEVVLHEYGHAIQDNQVPGFGSGDEQGAMGEGFGDFFAAMITLEKGDPSHQAARRYCVADWDAVSYNPVDPGNPGGGCLRWIDGTDEGSGADIGRYSNSPEEVHDDGRYWAAGMTCIFEGLGGNPTARDKALRLVLDSQQNLVPIADNTAFEKHIEAMIVSDQNLYGGANVALIRNCAAERGLATLTETDPGRDKTPPEVAATINPAAPDGSDGFYTNDVRVTWTVLDRESAVTTNGCGPVTVDRDTGDSGVTLTCTATSSGGMTSKSVTIRRRSPADAKAPTTTIDKHPRKRTRRHRARFHFASDEGGTSFKCRLDDRRFRKCDSPKKVRVRTGKHTFRVRATDAAGNVEDKATAFTWTVKPRKHRRGRP